MVAIPTPPKRAMIHILPDMNAIIPLRVDLHLINGHCLPILRGFHPAVLVHPPHEQGRYHPEQELYGVPDLHVVDNVLVLEHHLNAVGFCAGLFFDEVYY